MVWFSVKFVAFGNFPYLGKGFFGFWVLVFYPAYLYGGLDLDFLELGACLLVNCLFVGGYVMLVGMVRICRFAILGGFCFGVISDLVDACLGWLDLVICYLGVLDFVSLGVCT